MGGLRTLLAVLLLAGGSAGAGTLPTSPSQQLQTFATCAGRLSATIEHLWLVDPAASDGPLKLRRGFDDLIDAVLPDALAFGVPAELPMHWRVSAKAAQRELLTLSTFGTDSAQGEKARGLAAARLAECTGLLVS